MTVVKNGGQELNYWPCRYGDCKLTFRGPKQDLGTPYVAFFGGIETYGKFLAEPFIERLRPQLDLTCVNFGCANAGADLYVQDSFLLQAASRATVTVVEAMSAQNNSNRFYTVHPRRNDRFVQASAKMQLLFPDIDFAQISFTKHLLQVVKDEAPDRFAQIEEELQEAWIGRMHNAADFILGDVILLWVDQSERPEAVMAESPLGPEPLFVNEDMIAKVAPHFTEVVKITPTREAFLQGTQEMVFSPMESLAASSLLSGAVHQEIADQLGVVLRDYV